MSSRYDVVIVGGGHAGAQTAIALRQLKFGGSIAVVGEEPELPYERPLLSKDYLTKDKGFERILIRPARFWEERGVAMLTGRNVASVDVQARTVTTAAGSVIGYCNLVWAAGARARQLCCVGSELAGIHSVRTRADVDRLLSEIGRVERIGVIGGGYIGLEIAAAFARFGKQLTIVEAQDRVLARVSGSYISRFLEREHRDRGAEMRLGSSVECIEGRHGRVAGIRLKTGELISCDPVIVGIGIIPSVEPLLNAGARVGNGVVVWIKTIARREKTSFRGRDRVAWAFTFAAAAYNLVRLPKLIAEAG